MTISSRYNFSMTSWRMVCTRAGPSVEIEKASLTSSRQPSLISDMYSFSVIVQYQVQVGFLVAVPLCMPRLGVGGDWLEKGREGWRGGVGGWDGMEWGGMGRDGEGKGWGWNGGDGKKTC